MKRHVLKLIVAMAQLPLGLFYHLIRLTPDSITYRGAGLMGRMIRTGMKGKIKERLGLVFPGKYEKTDQFREFWRKHVRHLGLSCFEPVYLVAASDETLLKWVSLEGEEYLHEVLKRKEGAVMFINHLGNPGAIVAGFGIRNYDITLAGNRIVASVADEGFNLDRVETMVQGMFKRGRVKRALLGENLPRQFGEVLKRNGLFGMFIDFPVVTKHNQRMPLGEASMMVNLGPALLALRRGAPVMTVTCFRIGKNRHHLRIRPPLPMPSPESGGLKERAETLMSAAIAEFAEDLLEHPDQWWPWDWADITLEEQMSGGAVK